MQKFILLFTLLLGSNISRSNGLDITNLSCNEITSVLSFDLSWENSFLVEDVGGICTIYDGAWIIVKYALAESDQWHHADVVAATSSEHYFMSTDQKGVMIWDNSPHTNTTMNITVTVTLGTLTGSKHDFKVFGTEMVNAPFKTFEAGDAISEGRYYMNGDTLIPFEITNGGAYTRESGLGEFDQVGSIVQPDMSADYPNGYEAFWAMKYKISTEQYIDFLNCLTRVQQNTRTQSDLGTSVSTVTNRYVMSGTSSVVNRNPIKCDQTIGIGRITFYCDLDDDDIPNENNDGNNIVCNYLSRSDVAAFIDWYAMRVMSDL